MTHPNSRIDRLALAGAFVSGVALMLLTGFIAYCLWQAWTDGDQLARVLMEALGLDGPAPMLDRAPALGVAILWLSTDVIGAILLWQAWHLFQNIRSMGLFAPETARPVRRIGVFLFAIGPVSILANMLCTIVLNRFRDPTALHGSLSIEDADIYAMVIGLVILALGHIMVEAARLDAENRAFV